MKVVRVLDFRYKYEKDGKTLPSPSYRLYADNGHYVTIRPAFDKNKRDWFSLSQMVTDTIEIDENGKVKEEK